MIHDRFDSSLVDYVLVFRPPLLILGVIAALTVGVAAGKTGSELALIVVALATGNAGFNLINELRDVDVDRELKPNKPVPRGRVDTGLLFVVAGLLFTVAALVVLLLCLKDMYYGVFGAILFFTGACYNFFRVRGVTGNIILAVTYAVAVLFAGYPDLVYFAIAFGFWTFSFNLAVQIQDVEGDVGVVKTAPVQVGIKNTAVLSEVGTIFSALFIHRSVMTCEIRKLTGIIFLLSLSLMFILVISLEYIDKDLWNVLCQWVNRRLNRLLLLIIFVSLPL